MKFLPFIKKTGFGWLSSKTGTVQILEISWGTYLMEISRRSFFKKASLTALSAGLLLQLEPFALAQTDSGGHFPIPPEAQGDLLSQLNRASFESCLNSQFYFQPTESAGAYLRLTRTNDTRPAILRGTNSTQECFSLTFRGSARELLTADTHLVSHPSLGSFMLMITIIGRNGRSITYEAIINRLQPQ